MDLVRWVHLVTWPPGHLLTWPPDFLITSSPPHLLPRELKNNASKLLLAIMESRTPDSENVADKIIYNLNPRCLVVYIVLYFVFL